MILISNDALKEVDNDPQITHKHTQLVFRLIVHFNIKTSPLHIIHGLLELLYRINNRTDQRKSHDAGDHKGSNDNNYGNYIKNIARYHGSVVFLIAGLLYLICKCLQIFRRLFDQRIILFHQKLAGLTV